MTTSGRTTKPSSDGENEPLPPDRSREDEPEVDREPESDEDGELAEVCERRDGSAGPRPGVGSSASPITIPATNTARKPEPCEDGRDSVDRRRRRAAPRAGTATDPAAGPAASTGAGRSPRPRPPRARHPSRGGTPTRRPPTPAVGTVASSIIPIIKAIPTGSLKPDSPFEDRAGAALDLLAGEHRERHRRIRGCKRGSDQEGDRPVEAEDVVGSDGDERRGAERPEHSEDRDRDGGGAEPAQADAHAAVEEDRDQRQRRDALDVLERQQAREPVGEVGGDRRDGEEERGRRQPDPGGDDTDDDRERKPAGDDEDDAPEVDDVGHAGDSPCSRVRDEPRAANTFLTGVSLQAHSGSRYCIRMRLAALILLVLGLSAGVGDGRGAGAPGLARDQGRTRRRPGHRQGGARRTHRQGLAEDRRSHPGRPVEPLRERHPPRQGRLAQRAEHRRSGSPRAAT